MISHLSHTSVFVLDQDSAKAFYTGKLGFEVRTTSRWARSSKVLAEAFAG